MVWCWDDLWRAVREGIEDGPGALSTAAARSALGMAIERAKDAGALVMTAGVADWPGFRRRVRDRIRMWTRLERAPEDDLPREAEVDPAVAEEWAVFGEYWRILQTLDGVDSEGLALWASTMLGKRSSPTRRFGTVTVLDLEDDPPSVRRALAAFEASAKSVRVTLAHDPDPALAEAFTAAAPIRARMLERGYVEEPHALNLGRVAGLRDAERELFRLDAHARPPIKDGSGLTLLAAPQGEGVGLVVAREVRRLLVKDRVAPEDVLVLVRSWDEDAESVLSVLRSWGLPVSAVGRSRGLNSEPAVSLPRRVLGLPVGGWEASEVVRVLRHGRFRPSWPEARAPGLSARAAAVVRQAEVFRGRDSILKGCGRQAEKEQDDRQRSEIVEARALVERLFVEVEACNTPGPWSAHARRLRRLVESLGMVVEGDEPLERLFDAVADHVAVREGAGENGSRPFAEFVAAVETLAGEASESDDDVAAGTVVMTTVDNAAGARARYIVLANLAEGTFPSRAAADNRSFGREMARFLRVIGSARDGLILAYPTRDEKGQEVLQAGFLDDLLRKLDPHAPLDQREQLTLLDSTLMDHADLAVAPADARSRAVALACIRRETDDLDGLASDPAHRRVLRGSAAALTLTADRLGSREFSAYDGLLADPAALAVVAGRFGPDSVFSPSQLESYLACPFQFFAKFVLKLSPVDDRDDLDENFRHRGDLLHQVLEELEQLYKRDGGNRLDLAPIVIQTRMEVELTDGSEIAPGLMEIEKRRVERTVDDYIRQMDKYRDDPKTPTGTPAHFEVAFGGSPGDETTPHLVLGEGLLAVRLRGTIDRVDVIETADGPMFRVIDYKTGLPPSSKSVQELVMVQLPLYALAVERLGLAGEASFADVGYWALKSGGYKKVTLADWPEVRERLETKVLESAAALRSGLFVVRPEKKDCDRTCDYSLVCRIGQVRRVAKSVETGRSTP